MKFSAHAVFFLLALVAVLDHTAVAAAKKPSRPTPANRKPVSRSGGSSSSRPPASKRKYVEEDDEEEDGILGFDDPFEEEDEPQEDDEIEEDVAPVTTGSRRPSPPGRGGPPPSRSSAKRPPPKAVSSRKRPSSARSRYDFDEEDDLPRRPTAGRGPPPRRSGPPPSRRGGRPGRSVVPYNAQPEESALTKGIAALRSSLPDPGAVREAAVKSLNVARETTSSLSANLYREVKGLTSSELEQVMLKATRPDDTAVKSKHVERLVGVTYQISSRYDVYDAVLRKLWSKMAEKDWRTTIKALYILHRFSADGAPEHAPALKVCTFEPGL